MDGQFFFKCAIIIYFLFICVILWRNNLLYTPQRDNIKDIKPNVTEEIKRTTEIHNVTEETERKPVDIRKYLPFYIGPGADGGRVKVPQNDENYKTLREKHLKYEVNNFLSEMVGLKRIQPDRRPEVCKTIEYPSDLSPVSIIITFRDEPATTLLRTVYCILETTPARLIEEIILIDDGSVDLELLATVKVHVANVEKLKVLRNEKSVGLMKARQRGILAAKADYFIVLDGHVEVTPGWLEPVLYRLREQPKSLLTSHIGVVRCEDFGFFVAKHEEWFLFFDQIGLNEHWVHYSNKFLKARNGSVAPIPYGMVPGMMMAMKKSFFLQLGGFDQGMEIWGAEHMEMSVKVWLCGGRVEMLPCSIVGHLYRPAPWYKFHPNNDYVTKNLFRFALVWMDGYLLDIVRQVKRAQNFTQFLGNIGDLSERKQIKIDNKCHPYQYYVDQIRAISDTYIPIKPREKGVIRNVARTMCLDRAHIDGRYSLILYQCSGNPNQYFVFTEDSCLRADRTWILVDPQNDQLLVRIDEQNWLSDEFKWSYEQSGEIKHRVTRKCLTADASTDKITLELCKDNFPLQQWKWAILP